MDLKLVTTPPVYRCVVDGAPSDRALGGVAEALLPLLAEDVPHLVLDTRRAQVLTDGAIGLLVAPLLKTILGGGGVALVSPPPELSQALEKLDLRTRIPVVSSQEQALEAILRMIPKRYSNEFFQLLLSEGVATNTQIKDLHGEYKRNGGSIPFGTLLIKKGFLDTERLLAILDRVDHPERYPEGTEAEAEEVVATPVKTTPVGTGGTAGTTTMMGGLKSEFFEKRLLGEILIETGVITEVQLRKALDDIEFKSGRVKLGDLLIQKGLVQPAQVFEALSLQSQRKGAPEKSSLDLRSEFVQRSLLGEILVERGLIQEEHLRLALEEQKGRPNSRLGDILLQMGVIGTSQLLEALEYQANRRE